MDTPFGVAIGTVIAGEDNLERFLDKQVRFLYFVLDILCIQYSIQVVNVGICCKRF